MASCEQSFRSWSRSSFKSPAAPINEQTIRRALRCRVELLAGGFVDGFRPRKRHWSAALHIGLAGHRAEKADRFGTVGTLCTHWRYYFFGGRYFFSTDATTT